MIRTATVVPPRSDIFVERASELALDFAEDAACFVPEMGAMVHSECDAIQKGSLAVASTFVILYQTEGLLTKLEREDNVRWKN